MHTKIITSLVSAATLLTISAPIAMANTTTNTYTTRPGDSLYKISTAYRISLSSIVKLNRIANPNRINAGEVLTLPVRSYIVQPRDSLWKIGQRFRVTTASLQLQNKIANPSNIYIGQALEIPYEPALSAEATPTAKQTNTATPTKATKLTKAANTPGAVYLKDNSATTTRTASRSFPAPVAKNVGPSIVATARGFLGSHPYVSGGDTPAGWDCSGFTSYVFAKNSITLPRVSRDQAKAGSPVAKNKLRPGDLVFFSGTTAATARTHTVSHVGIYVGGGNFIYESSGKNAIIISSLSNTYWAPHYSGARQVV